MSAQIAQTTFADIAPTVGKLLRLLGSDQDHEALGAARALKRVLTSVKLDLHDLANVVEFAARHEAPRIEMTAHNPVYRASARSDVVREMLRCCREHSELLSAKEFAFVCSIAKWRGQLSPGQLAWLIALHERCMEHASC
jgi:hypothetical protein